MRKRRKASARCEGRCSKIRLCPPFLHAFSVLARRFNAHQNRQIIELECVAELGGSAIYGAGAAEGGELGQGNEAIVVGVELVHDVAELILVGEGEVEGVEDGAELPM